METQQTVKHTPGPWKSNGRVVEQFNSALGLSIRPLASLPKYEEAEANAFFIAAAPELEDRLRMLVMAIGTEHQTRAEIKAVELLNRLDNAKAGAA